MASEERQVSGFSKVVLKGVGNLHIDQGADESLRIEAESDVIPQIITEVVDGVLTIKYRMSIDLITIGFARPVDFFITCKQLSGVRLAGSGAATVSKLRTQRLTIEVDGTGTVAADVEADELLASIAGAGNLTFSGSVRVQDVRIMGAGEYKGRDLASRACRVDIAGAGKATVRVSETLEALVSGAGTVAYIGEPNVTQKVGGAAKVVRIEG